MDEYIVSLRPLLSAQEFRALERLAPHGRDPLAAALKQLADNHADQAVKDEAQTQYDALTA